MKYRKTFTIIIIIILSYAFLHVMTKLPDRNDAEVSSMISDGENTSLGREFKPQLEQHPGKSGVILLGNGRDAFVGRAVLARLAEKSIDVQYYMFHQDTVGRLLIREFIAAADRGVRVRMHSKTYTVDNQAPIVGGRNIGDEYFDANKDVAFSDLDAMSIGTVVPEVSIEFDQYWNNRHSTIMTFIMIAIIIMTLPMTFLRNNLQ